MEGADQNNSEELSSENIESPSANENASETSSEDNSSEESKAKNDSEASVEESKNENVRDTIINHPEKYQAEWDREVASKYPDSDMYGNNLVDIAMYVFMTYNGNFREACEHTYTISQNADYKGPSASKLYAACVFFANLLGEPTDDIPTPPSDLTKIDQEKSKEEKCQAIVDALENHPNEDVAKQLQTKWEQEVATKYPDGGIGNYNMQSWERFFSLRDWNFAESCEEQYKYAAENNNPEMAKRTYAAAVFFAKEVGEDPSSIPPVPENLLNEKKKVEAEKAAEPQEPKTPDPIAIVDEYISENKERAEFYSSIKSVLNEVSAKLLDANKSSNQSMANNAVESWYKYYDQDTERFKNDIKEEAIANLNNSRIDLIYEFAIWSVDKYFKNLSVKDIPKPKRYVYRGDLNSENINSNIKAFPDKELYEKIKNIIQTRDLHYRDIADIRKILKDVKREIMWSHRHDKSLFSDTHKVLDDMNIRFKKCINEVNKLFESVGESNLKLSFDDFGISINDIIDRRSLSNYYDESVRMTEATANAFIDDFINNYFVKNKSIQDFLNDKLIDICKDPLKTAEAKEKQGNIVIRRIAAAFDIYTEDFNRWYKINEYSLNLPPLENPKPEKSEEPEPTFDPDNPWGPPAGTVPKSETKSLFNNVSEVDKAKEAANNENPNGEVLNAADTLQQPMPNAKKTYDFTNKLSPDDQRFFNDKYVEAKKKYDEGKHVLPLFARNSKTKAISGIDMYLETAVKKCMDGNIDGANNELIAIYKKIQEKYNPKKNDWRTTNLFGQSVTPRALSKMINELESIHEYINAYLNMKGGDFTEALMSPSAPAEIAFSNLVHGAIVEYQILSIREEKLKLIMEQTGSES